MSPTRSRLAAWPLAIAALLTLLTAGLCGCRSAGEQPGPAPAQTTDAAPTDPNAAAVPAAAGAKAQVTLLFADDQGKLQPEKRDLPWEGAAVERARRVVQALLDGPTGARGRSLTAVIPTDTTLRALYLRDDGTVYVDLDAAFARGLTNGSRDALLAVWSITDTLAANLPEVLRVQILVEGEEVQDLGGHLDLSRPLVPGAGTR